MLALQEKLEAARKGNGARQKAFTQAVQTLTGIELSPEDAALLVQYNNIKKLFDGALTIQESVLQSKIIENKDPLAPGGRVEINLPGTSPPEILPVGELKSVAEARELMAEKIRQVFWQVDPRVLEPVIRMSAATLQPNVIFNREENNRRLESISKRYPSATVTFQTGDVLVPFRKELTDNDLLLLSAYLQERRKTAFRDLSGVLFVSLFFVFFYNVFLSRIIAGSFRRQPQTRLLLSLLIISLILMKLCLVLTHLPIYALPFALLPMLVIALNHGRIIGVGTTIVGALLMSLFCGKSFEMLLYFTIGGLAAVMISSSIRKRLQLMMPSVLIGFINVACVMTLLAGWQWIPLLSGQLPALNPSDLKTLYTHPMVYNLVWAFAGGLAAGPLTLILLPVLEFSWQTASSFKLNRYSDLQHPLLKRMFTEAPGTYQHSMTVAYLAQSAGEAIGANTLLLRIGAYYHDIGKMSNPRYFIENQFNGENPHDYLDAHESAELIVNHVKNGVKLALNARLPKTVVDMILQHHGTQIMEYFYHLAVKSNPKSSVNESHFRYPGPKPQSIEAAILTIADAVEAASRSLQQPTRKKFEKMVRLITVKRIADGQFGDCFLTTRDIEKLTRSLVDSLEASFHSRIRYPWQEGAKKPNKKHAQWIVGVEEIDQEVQTFRL
jgi:putative nucleotidyltransferase with HDIG domain